MDTVQEETTSNNSCEAHGTENVSSPPSRRMTGDSLDMEGQRHVLINSRRPSAIIAALRSPSQTLALNAAHTVMNQKKLMTELLQHGKHARDAGAKERDHINYLHNQRLGDDALTIALSALYAKLIVVLGIAFPVTEIISLRVAASFYQGFYLYLYTGSVFFVVFIFATLIREKAALSAVESLHKNEFSFSSGNDTTPVVRYGSFYLRLGAIGFGIGSMVYSGLEFGQYFELKKESHCSNVLIALTPAARMILTIVQVQFIFTNSKEMEHNKYKMVARFGIMHMIATNVCEWLYVLVEETKHEIVNLELGLLNYSSLASNSLELNTSDVHTTHRILKRSISHHDIFECKRTNIMGSLVQKVSPFLFPCTIEYSLICAVILFEMWKNVNVRKSPEAETKKAQVVTASTPRNNSSKSRNNSMTQEKLAHHFSFLLAGHRHRRSSTHFSVDCANAHRGLFGGILIIVMTIISLIMFFVLKNYPSFNKMAIFEVNICELVLYTVTLLAVIVAMIQMRDLKYHRKKGAVHSGALGLDTTLLVMAQSGVFLYCMFSIIGCYFTIDDPEGSGVVGFVAELLSLIQTVFQTMFILDAWWRRCRSAEQAQRKPGRQMVTFLLVANIALWVVNTLEKNRAEFRPVHLRFFGVWAWTIITHVSMPMAIFYRFHSTICLFEIWKTGYKMKPEHHH